MTESIISPVKILGVHLVEGNIIAMRLEMSDGKTKDLHIANLEDLIEKDLSSLPRVFTKSNFIPCCE